GAFTMTGKVLLSRVAPQTHRVPHHCLSTLQFLLEESDLGQNRAKASQRALAELNPCVEVERSLTDLSQVVVLTESPLEEQLHVGNFCHTHGICFIVADAKGLAGQLFCDFGEHFVVDDPAEGDPASAAVQHISQGNPGVVTCVGTEDSYGHPFRDGDLVTFSGVQGMTELNGQKPIPVHVLDDFRLEIGDTSSFSPYRCGGLVSQVQRRLECSHVSLSRTHGAATRAGVLLCHSRAQESTHQIPGAVLHATFRALHAFRRERGRLPRPRAPADAERVLELARSLGEQQGPLDEDIVRAFASVSAGDLCPVASVVGALAAQEVLKAITRKFVPLNQWLYLDSLECLALPGAAQLTEMDCAPRGSRYDGQIAIFGANFQEKLGHQKYLVVGAGAIGCELLKNFAMMGLTAGDGELIVTDMDTVALSNLHRQLLYRSADISEPKSVVAAAAVQRMNPDVRVTAHQNQVGPATEMLYSDKFFQDLDGVASALDTIEARDYLERRCLRCRTPLLDSGTEGTRGHVLAMVPSLTKPPGPASIPRDGTFPLCTLRHFPRTIQHTLQWARDEFEGLFQLPAEQVNQITLGPASAVAWFCRDPGFLEQQPPGKVLEQVLASLQERPRDWRDCVRWARRRWQSCYHDAIAQLLHTYPPEHVSPVRFPGMLLGPAWWWWGFLSLLQMTQDDPDQGGGTPAVPQCRSITPGVPVPPDHRQLTELTQDLVQWRQELVGAEEAQDNDVHIDFITAASNLRAENYGISPADCKQIAGRIVPAIITTTAAVAGLACLEVYKLVWGCQDLSCYRSSNVNLSACLLHRFLPSPAPTYWVRSSSLGKCRCPDWDRLRYRGAFVWGFMACEAVLPARQEAPIGTRLARGAQGRGQEEGEGGDSTALLRLQHHFGLMAAPGPLKPHARPCVILPVVTRGWHQPWMENAAGSGHALRALQQHPTPPCPRARTAGVTFHTQLLGSGGNTCPRGLLSMTYIPWGPGEPTLGASLVQRNMLPRARVMYFAGGGPGHGFPSVPEQLLPR
uniref:E1 ubiquitin-activating enzyme n=1 Tax=Zosterops lateralis melanops TaxID=1220523 RepID=A0A8D2PXL2_ZOSLA